MNRIASAKTRTNLNDSYNLRYDWAIPGYDTARKLVVPAIYRLPQFRTIAAPIRALVGDPNLPCGQRTYDRWLNTAALPASPNYVWGNQSTRLSTFGVNGFGAIRSLAGGPGNVQLALRLEL